MKKKIIISSIFTGLFIGAIQVESQQGPFFKLEDNQTVATLHWQRETNWSLESATNIAGDWGCTIYQTGQQLGADKGIVVSNLLADIRYNGQSYTLSLTNKSMSIVHRAWHTVNIKIIDQ